VCRTDSPHRPPSPTSLDQISRHGADYRVACALGVRLARTTFTTAGIENIAWLLREPYIAY